MFLIILGDKLERDDLFCLLLTFQLICELWINNYVT